MMTSRSVMARRKARSVTLRIMRWQCIAPLGKPVVPEVYMRKARSSGSTASARAARAASSTARAAGEHRAPRDGVRAGLVPEQHDVPELGQPRGRGRDPGRHQLAHHGQVVDGAGALGQDQRDRVRLVDDVRDVLGAQPRVDRHEHRADLHHREGGLDPLGAIEEPERDLVAGADAEGDQPLGRAVDARGEVGEREASPLEAERLARAPPPRRPLGQGAQRLLLEPLTPLPPMPWERLLRLRSPRENRLAMRRVQLRGGARRQPARRTFRTWSRLSRAPTKQMGPYHRSSGETMTLPMTSRSSMRRRASRAWASGRTRSMTGWSLPPSTKAKERLDVLAHPAVRAQDLQLVGPDVADVGLGVEAGGGAAGEEAPAAAEALERRDPRVAAGVVDDHVDAAGIGAARGLAEEAMDLSREVDLRVVDDVIGAEVGEAPELLRRCSRRRSPGRPRSWRGRRSTCRRRPPRPGSGPSRRPRRGPGSASCGRPCRRPRAARRPPRS